MPILRSAFQPGKQMPNHSRQTVSQNSSADSLTNMTKSSDVVSIRKENSNIVEITTSNPESPVSDQTSDHFFVGKDQELVEVLDRHGCYESEEGMVKRRAVVSELETLVKQWIRSVGLSKGLGWRLVEEAEGRLLTYGSYRLGAVSRDGDIDLLCVAPEHVDRNDFFNSLYSLLEKRSRDITELRCLSEAFVPVIKMRFKGIEVDLTFASLHCRKIPSDDSFIQLEPIGHLDPRCHHSLNGYRATVEILDLVPDIPSFLVALRAVKLWAKKNGIYGNILGFPGGFSWTILVVKTCQDNQGASPSELVSAFFQTWTCWRWPEPVYIRPPGLQPHPAWNPDLNPVDALHCMPVLTPTTPQINSTNLVTASTLQVIRARLQRSLRVCEDIRAGRDDWNSLFQGPCFFTEYKDFLMVAGSCEFGYATLYGLIESQLRHLKDYLERECGVNAAQVWPIAFNREDDVSVKRMWFLGVEMQPGHDVGSIQQSLNLFQDLLLAKLYRSKKYNNTMTVTVHPVRGRNLSDYISQEEMELPERKKRSYAAVTLGSMEDEKRRIPETPVLTSTSVSPSHQELKITHLTKIDSVDIEVGWSNAPVLEMQNLSISPITASPATPVSFQSAGAPTDPTALYQGQQNPPPTFQAGLYQAPSTPHKIQLVNANYLQPSLQQFFTRPTVCASSPKVMEDKTTQTLDENQNKHSREGSRRSDQVPYQNRQISSSERLAPDQKSFSRPHFPSKNNTHWNYSKNAPRGDFGYRSYPSKTYNRNKPPKHKAETAKESPKDCSSQKKQQSAPTSVDEEAKLRNNPAVIKPVLYNNNTAPNNSVLTNPMPSNNNTTPPISTPSPTVNKGWDHRTPLPPSPVIPQLNLKVPPPHLNSNQFTNSFVAERRNSPLGRPVGDENATLLGHISQDTSYLPKNNIRTDTDSEKHFSSCGAVHLPEGNGRPRYVSNSSDNYSPSNVTGARVTHVQYGPVSPMWSVDPLCLMPDLTVPPPSLSVDISRTQLNLSTDNSRTSRPSQPQVASVSTENSRTSPPNQPTTNSNPRPSFATAMALSNENRQRNTPRRISENEIRDAPEPQPVNIPKKINIR